MSWGAAVEVAYVYEAYTFYPKVSFRKYKILKGNKNSTTNNKTAVNAARRSTSSRSDFQKKTDLVSAAFF